MSLVKQLVDRQIGIPFKFRPAKTVLNLNENDWKRDHLIIPLNTKNKCSLCNQYPQTMLIQLPELFDIFNFTTHYFIEVDCSYHYK